MYISNALASFRCLLPSGLTGFGGFYKKMIMIAHQAVSVKTTLNLDGSARFRWVRSPTSQELTQLAQTIAHRVSRFLERQGLLERDADDCMDAAVRRSGGRATQGAVAENSYLTTDAVSEDPMNQLLGHSMM